MEKPANKYAVLNCDTSLLLHLSAEMLPCIKPEENTLYRSAGTTVKLHQTWTISEKNQSAVMCTVEVLYYGHNKPIHADNLYECSYTNLHLVTDYLWPFIICIPDPKRRLQFLRNADQYHHRLDYKVDDFVYVNGEILKKKVANFKCVIRYIGPVNELYPVGYVFGLEISHINNDIFQQIKDTPFAEKYFKFKPSFAIFTTIDWIIPLECHEGKSSSALNFINGKIDRVLSAIGNAGDNLLNSTNTGSDRKLKKDEKKPSAKFYEPIDLPVVHNSTSMDRKNVVNILTPPSVNITDAESKANHDSSVEIRSTGKSSPNIVQQIQPVGILKNARTTSNSTVVGKENSSSTTGNTTLKPTVVNINNQDIYLIDKPDDASEGNVIVVPKEEMDLYDMLRGNWPESGGSVAALLNSANKFQKDSSQVTLPSNTVSAKPINNTSALNTSKRNRSPNSLLRHSASRSGEGAYQRNKSTKFEATESLVKVPSGEQTTTAAQASDDSAAIGCEDSDLGKVESIKPSPLQEIPDTGLVIGSMVEVSVLNNKNLHGVIQWIGVPSGDNSIMVGVELEDEAVDKELCPSNGSYLGVPLFKCPEGRAIFVAPNQCKSDRRFTDMEGAVGGKLNVINNQQDTKLFGQVECPSVPGAVPPLRAQKRSDLEKLCGKFKGIQGHHNSCYLDATLFSMFTFTTVFDSLLFRPPDPDDIPSYLEVQKVLREEIVNPLRKNVFVRADRVMKLRKLLDKLSSVSGLTSEEKDPEEFLNSLLAQIMHVEPFLKLSSGQDAYFYQLFVEKDERLIFPTVQQLFEQSFHSSDIKLKEVPSCLIIQMPRFGKNFKMYPRILPSQVLDVTDIIEDSPRQCSVCGNLADHECRDCFGKLDEGLGGTAFCYTCLDTAHKHEKRANHNFRKLSIPEDYTIMAEHQQNLNIPRLYMELFAVVCIETSHYVAFVKTGFGPDAPWCFFDSMADREGEKNGYNIPNMHVVPNLPQWLTEEGARSLNETPNEKLLPPLAKRLFCDAYMCMYQSSDVMMYR
ncbi:uncharacterized protein LOC119687095 isoform X2 [Teleopsis dalmanni]|uniref:uncharacterized protein LOC119687095 isoform X2 n=1 Tax=Teleopsis dalmanni TaxID=139649 RepID=UPI0018CE229B|nr:uncharacterized protein LOC119687095 isoform X2 [Teleopsis dalmanni]